MQTTSFQLVRNHYGQLVLTDKNGEVHENVTPVRAFPIAAPQEGISLISSEGHEVGWANHLNDLPAETARLIEEELSSREFVPEIQQIHAVSGFSCPSTWQLSTDRGRTELILKGEEDIRRLSATRLLIADANGIQFLVRDLSQLDRQSKKILDRFL